MSLEKELTIDLAKLRYIDYLSKINQLNENIAEGILVSNGINKKDSNIVKYFIEEISSNLSNIEDNFLLSEAIKDADLDSMNRERLVIKLIEINKQIKDLLIAAKRTPQGYKHAKQIQKQIDKIDKIKEEVINGGKEVTKRKIILTIVYYATIIAIVIGIIIGSISAGYFLITSFGFSLITGEIVAMSLSTIGILFTRIISIILFFKIVVKHAAKKELTRKEKKKILEKANKIAKETKKQLMKYINNR